MKNITKLVKPSFAFLAFALPLAIHAQDSSSMNNTPSGSMMTTNVPQMNTMASNTTNNMTPPSMNPTPSGGMMTTTNQPAMGATSDMQTNTVNSMTPPSTNSMAPNSMTSTNQP